MVLQNAPDNQKQTSHDIQKDIMCAAVTKTRIEIVNDLENEYFIILVDESRDVSTKVQMAVGLLFVHIDGHVIMHFLGILHINDTNATTLRQQLMLCLLHMD